MGGRGDHNYVKQHELLIIIRKTSRRSEYFIALKIEFCGAGQCLDEIGFTGNYVREKRLKALRFWLPIILIYIRFIIIFQPLCPHQAFRFLECL